MVGGAGVVHRALDGSPFRLRGSLPLDGLATSTVDLVHGGGLRQLHSGVPDLGADVAAAAGLDGFDQELSYRGATLRTGRTSVPDPRDLARSDDLLVGAWLGQRHSLVAHLYNASPSELLELPGTLDIAEHPCSRTTACPAAGTGGSGTTTTRAGAAPASSSSAATTGTRRPVAAG